MSEDNFKIEIISPEKIIFSDRYKSSRGCFPMLMKVT